MFDKSYIGLTMWWYMLPEVSLMFSAGRKLVFGA